MPPHKFAEPFGEAGGASVDTDRALTPRLRRAAQSGKGRFLLATFQEVVDSIRPDAACLQVRSVIESEKQQTEQQKHEYRYQRRNKSTYPGKWLT